MDKFWQFLWMTFYYKRLLIIAAFAAVVDAMCKVGGFAALPMVIKLFIDPMGPGIDELLRERAAKHSDSFIGDFFTTLADMIPDDRWWALATVLGLIFLLTIIGSCARFTHEYLTFTVSLRTVSRIRRRVFTRLVHLPMHVASETKSAESVARVIRDSHALSSGFSALTGKTVSGVLGGLGLFFLALYQDWKLTLLFLTVVPAIAIVIRKFGKRIRRASKKALRQYGVMLGGLTESLQGLRVVKVHHAEGYERRRFNQMNRRMLDRQLQARVAKALSAPVIETLSLVGMMAVILAASWFLFDHAKKGQEINPTTLITVLVTLTGAAASFRQISGLNVKLQSAAAAAENIDQVLNMQVEAAPHSRRERKLPAHKRHSQMVTYENVTFSYPGSQTPAVRDIELHIPHGSVCAIVGANGSGKTTLLGLLPRLYEPDSGSIRIDGIDIRQVKLRSLRSQMAVVTQETVLFDATVGENIIYGARHVTGEQMIDASKRAHAHSFIEQLPRGYDTPVGERGQRLSGGQRQRIAIARAILRDPSILILDEATSQIDADSEAQISAALKEFTTGRTTFVIAHRLSTVVGADMIAVMDAGRIVALGRHQELLKTCEIYKTLCRTQLLDSSEI